MQIFAIVLAVVLATSAVAAEDDPMEMQRCIWRCLANSKGADDPAYGRCVERRCSDRSQTKRSRDRAKTQRRSDAPAPGHWTYGVHPRLGAAAYVDVGGEAYGLACPAARADGEPHGYAVVTKITAGLSPSRAGPNNLTSVWTGPFAVGGHTIFTASDGLLETESAFCFSDVERIRSSKSLLMLRERFVSLADENGLTGMTVEGDKGAIRIEGVGDLARLDAPVETPLAGARKAIAELARNCPPLRRQMAEGCDVD